jgi:hypothetical protein
MSSEPLTSPSARSSGWDRPFTLAYSNHTCNFLGSQIIIWSRVAFLAGANFLVFSDYLAAAVTLLGVLLGVPYVISLLRVGEIILDGGPSLVNDILPQWIFTCFLLLLLGSLVIADRLIGEGSTFEPALIIYASLSVVSLTFSILSATNHKDRVIVSVTLLMVCLQQSEPSTVFNQRFVVGLGFLISYLSDAYTIHGVREYCKKSELTLLRTMMILKLCTGVSFVFEDISAVTIFLMGLLFACQCAVYVHERKHGSTVARYFLSFRNSSSSQPEFDH